MKKILLRATLALVFAPPAIAADLPPRPYIKAPAVTAPEAVYNWTGFYVGGHVGGLWAGDNNIEGNSGRFLGGVQGGADYQFAPNWVAGVEAQYSWLATNDTTGVLFPGNTFVTQDTRGLGSVTGRLGYTWGPALLYAKGGYAWRDSELGVTVAGAPAAFTTSGNRNSGYTVGGGLEYLFAPNWSAKAEYQYYKFDNTNFTGGSAPVVGSSFRNDEHAVKAGINYRFGWGGPTATRY
jgi:outer membrane immunogenic protein